MTQIFLATTQYGAATLAAAIRSGLFGAPAPTAACWWSATPPASPN